MALQMAFYAILALASIVGIGSLSRRWFKRFKRYAETIPLDDYEKGVIIVVIIVLLLMLIISGLSAVAEWIFGHSAGNVVAAATFLGLLWGAFPIRWAHLSRAARWVFKP